MQAARIVSYRVMHTGAAFAVLCLWQVGPASPLQAVSAPLQTLSAMAKAELVDINRATIEELETLPGIRDAWAQAIAKNRPYKSKTQLLTRKILPFSAYKAIEDKIIAKQ
jgi:competence protein ComEA